METLGVAKVSIIFLDHLYITGHISSKVAEKAAKRLKPRISWVFSAHNPLIFRRNAPLNSVLLPLCIKAGSGPYCSIFSRG